MNVEVIKLTGRTDRTTFGGLRNSIRTRVFVFLFGDKDLYMVGMDYTRASVSLSHCVRACLYASGDYPVAESGG